MPMIIVGRPCRCAGKCPRCVAERNARDGARALAMIGFALAGPAATERAALRAESVAACTDDPERAHGAERAAEWIRDP